MCHLADKSLSVCALLLAKKVMNSYLRLSLQLFCLLSPLFLVAQVPRKVVVEHFTNTLCSICASRNPGFYSNLNSQQGVLHISYHPSSPYSGCLLSQHNVSGNDGRTNYYGIYGSTPRLVIQGTAITASANYTSPTIFSGLLNQTSPVSIGVSQQLFGSDSVVSTVIVKNVANNSLGGLSLYVALAEDTIFYNAPNGENRQLRVFRKALTPNTGQIFQLPAMVGDSLVFRYSSSIHPSWVPNRIYSQVIVQQTSNRAVIQAEASNTSSVVAGMQDDRLKEAPVQFYPNPFKSQLHVKELRELSETNYEFYNIHGQLLKVTKPSAQGIIDLSSLPSGLYIVKICSSKGYYTQTLIKD
jgi:hypothetical protein